MCHKLLGLMARSASLNQARDAAGLYTLWERALSEVESVCENHRERFRVELGVIEKTVEKLAGYPSHDAFRQSRVDHPRVAETGPVKPTK